MRREIENKIARLEEELAELKEMLGLEEEIPTKFKYGDKAIIVDRICAHKFPIGTVVTIGEVNAIGEDYQCYDDEGKSWFLIDEELDAIP